LASRLVPGSVERMSALSRVRSSVSATVTSSDLSAGGKLWVDAENNSTIVADNSSSVTSSGGSPFAQGVSTAYNVTIATNNVLSSTIASVTGGSLTTTNGGDVAVTALGNATIDAEMDAETESHGTGVGVVLAFNAIGIKTPVGGFFENTVDALFGTDLAGDPPGRRPHPGDRRGPHARAAGPAHDGAVGVSVDRPDRRPRAVQHLPGRARRRRGTPAAHQRHAVADPRGHPRTGLAQAGAAAAPSVERPTRRSFTS